MTCSPLFSKDLGNMPGVPSLQKLQQGPTMEVGAVRHRRQEFVSTGACRLQLASGMMPNWLLGLMWLNGNIDTLFRNPSGSARCMLRHHPNPCSVRPPPRMRSPSSWSQRWSWCILHLGSTFRWRCSRCQLIIPSVFCICWDWCTGINLSQHFCWSTGATSLATCWLISQLCWENIWVLCHNIICDHEPLIALAVLFPSTVGEHIRK